MTIGEEDVACMTKCGYLGSIIQRSGEIDRKVSHQIQEDLLKWRATTGVLCDRKFSSRLKSKFYRVAIRPSLFYETDCWPVKKTFEYKIEVAEMLMLRWIYDHTMMNRMITRSLERS